MKDLVIFALPAKLPKRIIIEIDFPNRLIAPRGKTLLPNFSDQLYEYKFIIGIGDYDGPEQTKIRLETECQSDTQALKINNFLEPIDGVIYSEDIGNSYCNYISFLITKNIPNSKYSFIHVPKTINSELATEKINKMIKNFLQMSS